MLWQRTARNDPRVRALADRHYNRQSVGAVDFTPPGRCVVLYAAEGAGEAFWVSSWQDVLWAKHAWAGAWLCTAFRNEGLGLSSTLILEAVAATRAIMGTPPELGMVTFVDPAAVRHKRDPGRCFRKAGFQPAGWTRKRGRLALQLEPGAMPAPELPGGVLI